MKPFLPLTALAFVLSAACAAQVAAPASAPATASTTAAFDPKPRTGPSAAFTISSVDQSKYKVEGNLPFDKPAACVVDVIYPKGMVKNDPSGKKYPGVVMFHGGGWIRTSKSTMSTFYNRYLAHGFVVCTAEYRLADSTGQFSPECAIAPAAVTDALKAAKWFWDHADEYNMDKSRYVVTGASAGGHLALMVGLCTDEKLGPCNPKDFKIAAIVNGYGPADVPDLLKRGTSWAVEWLPANTPNRDEIAKQVSPMTYVRKDAPPCITVQGANDNGVPVVQNQRLNDALKAAGADSDIHLVPGAGHGYQTPATAWPDAEKATFDWLAKHKIIPAATVPAATATQP
jgi:acetyl esterase/lipase